MKVKALQRFPYDGVQREVGDEFQVKEELHARILAHKGAVEIVDDAGKVATPEKPKPAYVAPPAPPPSYEPKVMTTTDDDESLSRPKRRYMRRDLKAQE